ncbi:hypothetical protein G6F24_018572 [Rhizopus arrhizus]|nr:hypothetical protein G6F24_018572 [Rhizopus arrhizus]
MGDGELGAGVDHAVGGRHGLLGFAAVVDDHGFELLAVHAASGVDAFDSRVDAFTDHVAILGDGAGGGADNANLDGLRLRSRRKHEILAS